VSDSIQPPADYSTTPPTEPGEYKIWYRNGKHSVAVVLRERHLIYVWGDNGKVCVEDIACLWGPRLDFP
jgi:hypothetical protein